MEILQTDVDDFLFNQIYFIWQFIHTFKWEGISWRLCQIQIFTRPQNHWLSTSKICQTNNQTSLLKKQPHFLNYNISFLIISHRRLKLYCYSNPLYDFPISNPNEASSLDALLLPPYRVFLFLFASLPALMHEWCLEQIFHYLL